MARRQPLFPRRRRSDELPQHHGEDAFTFLERVRDPYFAQIRVVLNRWLAAVPEAKATRLREQLRSGETTQSEGAFWELYLHEALRRTPLEVTLEPGPTKPDFHVVGADTEALIEATVLGESASDRAREQRIWQLTDILNRDPHPSFQIFFEIEAESSRLPSAVTLRREIHAWLDTFDNATERAALSSEDRLHTHRSFRVGEWQFEIRPWPLPLNEVGRASRRRPFIAAGPTRAGYGSVREIRRALDQKASKYALDRLPYVIALSTQRMFGGITSFVDALIGGESVRLQDGHLIRRRDGFWGSGQHTRVSAVLFVEQLRPWSITSAAPELWLNPWAAHPLAIKLPWARRVELATDGTSDYQPPDQSVADLFTLPLEWPTGKSFSRL